MSLDFETIEELEGLQSYIGNLTPDESLKINDVIKLMASYIDEAPSHFYEHCREHLEAKGRKGSNVVEIHQDKVQAIVDLALGMHKHTGYPQSLSTVVEALVDFAKEDLEAFYVFCIKRRT